MSENMVTVEVRKADLNLQGGLSEDEAFTAFMDGFLKNTKNDLAKWKDVDVIHFVILDDEKKTPVEAV